MYFCEENIKTINDACGFVCNFAWHEVGEKLDEVFDILVEEDYTVEKFADVLVETGVITNKTAKRFVTKFAGEKLNIRNVCGPSEQLEFFVKNADDDEIEKYFGVFYAALMFCEKSFNSDFWKYYRDDINIEDEYAMEEREETLGTIIYDMPVLPLI